MPNPRPPAPIAAEADLVGSRCLGCRHLVDLVEGTCLAFPDRIPLDILQDRIRHDRPFPGDHGYRFEPAVEHRRRPR
jgi:hypothetical protein